MIRSRFHNVLRILFSGSFQENDLFILPCFTPVFFPDSLQENDMFFNAVVIPFFWKTSISYFSWITVIEMVILKEKTCWYSWGTVSKSFYSVFQNVLILVDPFFILLQYFPKFLIRFESLRFTFRTLFESHLKNDSLLPPFSALDNYELWNFEHY